MRKLFVLVVVMSLVQNIFAQDQQFTQFYAVPCALNPAFAGAGLQSRFATQYRNQWSGIPKAFTSYVATFDTYVNEINSGFGLVMQRDIAGAGRLSRTQVGIQYAYETRIKKNLYIRPAIQFTLGARSMDFNSLTFYDQLIRNNAPISLETYPGQSVMYFDAGAGGLLYGPDFWVGVSAMHLNTPDESLYESQVSYIPVRYAFHGGKRFRIKGYSLRKLDHHVLVAANYLSQGKYDQLDLGCYYEFKPIIMGIWYRGLPVKSNGYQLPNRDALALLVGIQSGAYSIGYSYDITTSSLGVGSSAGSHEISLAYNLAVKVKSKRKILPCASF
jgi:type IX secretion system PorP/SprF family membrane protein